MSCNGADIIKSGGNFILRLLTGQGPLLADYGRQEDDAYWALDQLAQQLEKDAEKEDWE